MNFSYLLLLCMHAGPKGLAPGSWSADIGVGRPYHSLGLYYYRGAPGKSHSYSSSQQRKPQGDRGGRLMHVTLNTKSVNRYVIYYFHPKSLILLDTSTSSQELDVTTDYFTYICSSTARDIFLGVLYGYKMVLQVIALVLALSARKVKYKGLDDSKYIAAAIYITSIVLAVIMVATYTLKDFVNGFAALFCTGFLIGTTVILGLVFVPKVGECSSFFIISSPQLQIHETFIVTHRYNVVYIFGLEVGSR